MLQALRDREASSRRQVDFASGRFCFGGFCFGCDGLACSKAEVAPLPRHAGATAPASGPSSSSNNKPCFRCDGGGENVRAVCVR